MARIRLNHETVVDGAVELVNRRGAEALSLAEVAARFLVRTPSLYNHVAGLEGLRRDLSLRALRELGTVVGAAGMGLSGQEAVTAAANAWRAWALANPGLYAFVARPMAADDGEVQEASSDLGELFVALLRGYRMDAEARTRAAWELRAALHGWVSLEVAGAPGRATAGDGAFADFVAFLGRGLRGG